ncbi:MAG: site-specific integrase [Gammaproteobacteria bacterium]
MVKIDYLIINPIGTVKRLKFESDTRNKILLNREQVESLLNTPDISTYKGLRDRTIMYLYFYTGCRRSELKYLRYSDININDELPTIKFRKRNSNRIVPLNIEVINILKIYIKSSTHLHLTNPNIPFFTRVQLSDMSLIKPMAESSFNRIFKYYSNIAKLPNNITPHSARSTFIINALQNNCPIQKFQNTVNHKSIESTDKYFYNITSYNNSPCFIIKY